MSQKEPSPMTRVNSRVPICLCEECRQKMSECYTFDYTGYRGQCMNHSDRSGTEYFFRRKGTAQFVRVGNENSQPARRRDTRAYYREPWRTT